MTRVQRILRAVLVAQIRHPRLTLFVALALASLSVLYTVTNLEFQTSQKDLISPRNRLIRLSEQLDQFEDLDTFVVAIENQRDSRSLQFLRALAPLLEADAENYIQVFYRVDPRSLRPWTLLYLDKEDLQVLRDNLEQHRAFLVNMARSPGLLRFFREINREMASTMVGELFTGFLDEGPSPVHEEPLDLGFLVRVLEELRGWLDGHTLFASPWETFLADGAWNDEEGEGYFWTEGRRYLLLLVTPRKSDGGFANAQRSLMALRGAIAKVRADFPGLEVGVTGPEALNEDEMGAALRDMTLATAISLVGLALLLALFWRGMRRPLLEMTELIVALSWTFGLTTLFIGHLNILSVTFAPLLLGLGIDYGIHWFARYQEEEQLRGASKQGALEAAMLKLGPGILLAGLTAALSFVPLVLTGFKGLIELGLITSMGMVMTTVTTLCLLPALTLLFDKPGEKAPSPSSPPRGRYLLRLTNRRALVILIPATFGLALSLLGAGKVRFDLNMLRLQSKKAESVVWEKRLLQDSERSSMYGALLAHSVEEVREKAQALEALPTVSEVQSVESLLPSDQEEKLVLLRSLKPLVTEIEPLGAPAASVNPSELDEVLGRIRFKMMDSNGSDWGASRPLESQMARVRELIAQVRQRFHSMERSRLVGGLDAFGKALMEDLNDKLDIIRTNVNARPMRLEDLPEALLERFVGEDHLYLIRVFPAQDIWESSLLKSFIRDLRSVDPDAIGDPVTLYTFINAFRDACIRAAIYAVVFIVVLLLVTLRSIRYTLMALVPLAVGAVWTLGLMHCLGVHFNLANSLFLPLIVGAGVEYGIIILQRWREEGVGRAPFALPYSTAKGVILAGLTTTVGFGSLTISDHQGIHSLGLLAMVGSLSILAAAIFFLPALLQLLGTGSKGSE